MSRALSTPLPLPKKAQDSDTDEDIFSDSDNADSDTNNNNNNDNSTDKSRSKLKHEHTTDKGVKIQVRHGNLLYLKQTNFKVICVMKTSTPLSMQRTNTWLTAEESPER